MQEESKASAVAAIQQLESTTGLDNSVSAAVDNLLNENEEDDDRDNKTDLGTGIELTVPEGEVIQEGHVSKGRRCLVVLAALFVLPTVMLSAAFLPVTLIGIQVELSKRAGQTTEETIFAISATPDYRFCDHFPENRYCLERYGRGTLASSTPVAFTSSLASATLTSWPLASICQNYPWLEECLPASNRRKRRSLQFSLCSLHFWNIPCQKGLKRGIGYPRNDEKESDKIIFEGQELYGDADSTRDRKPEIDQVSEKQGSIQTPGEGDNFVVSFSSGLNTFEEQQLYGDTNSTEDHKREGDQASIKQGTEQSKGDEHSSYSERNFHQRQKRSQSDAFAFSSETATVLEYQSVLEMYEKTIGLFGIVSGILITVFNYRLVALAGTALCALGTLIAACIPPNKAGMTFALGFLTGVGNIFLVMSVKVAILEYFKNQRLRVLLLAGAAATIALLLFFLTQFLLIVNHGILLGMKWRKVLYYQFATYVGFCTAASVVLTPRNLHMRDEPRQSFRARTIGLSGLHLLKSPSLYILAGIFFFNGLGANLPMPHLAQAGAPFSSIFMDLGALLGALIGCCCRKQLSLSAALVWVASLGFLMGALTVTVEGANASFLFAIVYCALFGICSGVRTPLMIYIIPLSMGEEHLGLTVGVAEFAAGVGTIIGDESSGAIMRDYDRADAVFYMAGLALLISASCAVALRIKVAAVAKVQITSSDLGVHDDSSRPPTDATSRDESFQLCTIQIETPGQQST